MEIFEKGDVNYVHMNTHICPKRKTVRILLQINSSFKAKLYAKILPAVNMTDPVATLALHTKPATV